MATAPGADWVSIMTAFGTVGAVIAAVGIALWSDWRAGRERRLTRERAHLADAYAVQVVLMQSQAPPDRKRLKAIIINHGARTITRIETRFSLGGKDVITPISQVPLPARSNLPEDVQAYAQHLETVETVAPSNRLAPWDTGISVDTDVIAERDLTDPSVIVRWTDRSGTRWEHKRGDVRHVDDGEPWVP